MEQILCRQRIAGFDISAAEILGIFVLIENIVDEFECCEREGEKLDFKDIKTKAKCLIKDLLYLGE